MFYRVVPKPLIVSGMSPFGGPLACTQACIGRVRNWLYSGKLIHAVHLDGVF
jgi:hypothetical protein